MNYFLDAFNKYAVFSGKSTRKEYWMYTLFYYIFYFAIAIVGEKILGETIGEMFMAIFVLATFVPTLAISVRRMHDINKSGWWVLINLIPLFGLIIWIVLAATPSQDQTKTNEAVVNTTDTKSVSEPVSQTPPTA